MSRKGTDAGLVDELKVDKDCVVDHEWISDYVRSVVNICRNHGVKVVQIRMCPSRCKGNHFYIKIIPAMKSELANRLQFLLGDDCRRVDFNRARIRVGFKEWNKLFESPNKRLRTIYRGSASSQSTIQNTRSLARRLQHEHKDSEHRGRSRAGTRVRV